MGKITDALRKAAEDRITRLDRISRIREHERIIIKKMENSKVDSRLISYFDAKSPITEQYKILRTNLLSLNKGKPPRTITITSSIHAEGKSVTALNLAISMSQAMNKPKILLIDCDMRRGRLTKYLGIEQTKGLSDVLSGRASLEDVLFNIDIENLTFMASGPYPHNPVELLSSDYMKRLLAETRLKFDHVVIDTPPLIPVTDPGIVGALTDGVILVVQAGRTQRAVVNRATELLHQAQSKLLGYVLTNIEYHLPEYLYRYL